MSACRVSPGRSAFYPLQFVADSKPALHLCLQTWVVCAPGTVRLLGHWSPKLSPSTKDTQPFCCSRRSTSLSQQEELWLVQGLLVPCFEARQRSEFLHLKLLISLFVSSHLQSERGACRRHHQSTIGLVLQPSPASCFLQGQRHSPLRQSSQFLL